ncbi:MAG: hypothetical protein ACK4TC_14975 [Sphingomonas pseudosanguinis]|uniref:hypothetical protein n=1 Tax=Sphingomonas pseudosanguinis TaxID=413712 RepID=UPI00391A5CB2
MLHFAPPSTPPTPIVRPLTPDAYLMLRRMAAGLSRDDVARRIARAGRRASASPRN